MNHKTKIIIIGGTGFLGFHLAKFCLKKNWEVVSVSRKKPKKIRFIKEIKYIFVDIIDKKNLYKKLKNQFDSDYLVNFGGEVEHRKLKKTFLSHYNGLKNLSDIFLKKSLKKFIQIGSSLEYGKSKSPHKENFKINPDSNYAKAKALASKRLLKMHKKYDFPALIVRPYQVYGPYQDLNRFIPTVITNCIKNKTFPCSSGEQFRDFLFIDDFVKFIFRIIKVKKLKGEIFNVGFGDPMKIKNVIFQIRNLIGKGRPDIGKIQMRNEESLIFYPSINKAFKLIGWKPRIRFNIGLKKTMEYYQKY